MLPFPSSNVSTYHTCPSKEKNRVQQAGHAALVPLKLSHFATLGIKKKKFPICLKVRVFSKRLSNKTIYVREDKFKMLIRKNGQAIFITKKEKDRN
jgi:hypothetical protein